MSLNVPGQGINSPKSQAPKLMLPAESVFFGAKNPEVPQAYDAWKQNNEPANQKSLLKSLEPTMRSAAKKYTGADDPVTLGQAKLLVIKSLPRYDPSKAKLETFVDRQLQPLIRWKSRRQQSVKLPDRAIMELQLLRKAEKELELENGREPDTLELADHTGLSKRRIAQLRENGSIPVNSSREFAGEDGDTTYADEMAVEGSNFTSWAKTVRDDLPGPDRYILEHTIGLDGAEVLPNAEIARRLKISPGAVSQRKAKIQKLLDQQSELSPFYG